MAEAPGDETLWRACWASSARVETARRVLEELEEEGWTLRGDDVFEQARAERKRAHALHGETSMESAPVDALLRLTVLVEELTEVAEAAGHGMEPLPRTGGVGDLPNLLAHAGALARAYNDQRHRQGDSTRGDRLAFDPLEDGARAALRGELIQVGAMALAWADALDTP